MALETLDSEVYQLPRLAPATRRLLIEKKIAYYRVVFTRMEALYPTRQSLRQGLKKLGLSAEEINHVLFHYDLLERDGGTLSCLRWGSEPFLAATYQGGGVIWNRRVVPVTGKTIGKFSLPNLQVLRGVSGYNRERSGGGFPNTPLSGSGGPQDERNGWSNGTSSNINSIPATVHETQTPSSLNNVSSPKGATSFVIPKGVDSNETITEVKKVPEPSSVMGVVAVGVLGLFLRRTRR